MLFEPDFASEDAGFPHYPAGLYQVKITDYEPFAAMTEKNGAPHRVGGIGYSIQMAGRIDEEGTLQTTDEDGKEIAGKPCQKNTVWVHTKGGVRYSKKFLMAAHGYSLNQEEEANKKIFTDKKLAFDGELDTKGKDLFTVGPTYTEIVGNYVNVLIKEIPSKRDSAEPGEMDNDWGNWYPAS